MRSENDCLQIAKDITSDYEGLNVPSWPLTGVSLLNFTLPVASEMTGYKETMYDYE